MKNVPSIFRLKKKHTSLSDNDYNQVDALDVIREQSISSAMISAFMALVIMNILWVFISMIFDRFFPWFSLLQGIIIGISVKKFGRGIDWRFPIIASTFAIIAAITGNFLSALNLTGREFYTGALPLIIEISWFTVKTFFIKEFDKLVNEYLNQGWKLMDGSYSLLEGGIYSQVLVIDKENLDQNILQKEKEIITEELKNNGKDSKIVDKIAAGKLNKFINDNTLLNQEWVIEPKKKVKEVLKEVAGKDKIEIKKFVRFRVGEGV